MSMSIQPMSTYSQYQCSQYQCSQCQCSQCQCRQCWCSQCQYSQCQHSQCRCTQYQCSNVDAANVDAANVNIANVDAANVNAANVNIANVVAANIDAAKANCQPFNYSVMVFFWAQQYHTKSLELAKIREAKVVVLRWRMTSPLVGRAACCTRHRVGVSQDCHPAIWDCDAFICYSMYLSLWCRCGGLLWWVVWCCLPPHLIPWHCPNNLSEGSSSILHSGLISPIHHF